METALSKCDKADDCEYAKHTTLSIQCIHKEPHEHQKSCDDPCTKDKDARCVELIYTKVE